MQSILREAYIIRLLELSLVLIYILRLANNLLKSCSGLINVKHIFNIQNSAWKMSGVVVGN